MFGCFATSLSQYNVVLTDTEQLLLAGVMGAVVTLLVIALAIAAVAVRLYMNRRRRDERDNERDHNDNLHRNSSTCHRSLFYEHCVTDVTTCVGT